MYNYFTNDGTNDTVNSIYAEDHSHIIGNIISVDGATRGIVADANGQLETQ